MQEAFKPVAVRPISENRALFFVRCLVDLQLLTVFRFLRRELRACRGSVLDVGAGQSPWRDLLVDAEYVGIDVHTAGEFGKKGNAGIVLYDGKTIPFPDECFDCVMCIEVIEHVADPAGLLAEMARVLRRHGRLVLTVPWSARVHHVPHDYYRPTRYALDALLNGAGFENIRIEERGNDVAAIANKLVVLTVRLLRPGRWVQALWNWPLAALVAPVAVGFLAAAHASLWLRSAGREDPLGYGLIAEKS